MKKFTDLPKGVEKPNSPPAKPNLTKPNRRQYPPGTDGSSAFSKDLASWNATGQGTPSPGGGGKAPKSSQRNAMDRILKNTGYQNFDGEDR